MCDAEAFYNANLWPLDRNPRVLIGGMAMFCYSFCIRMHYETNQAKSNEIELQAYEAEINLFDTECENYFFRLSTYGSS